MAQEVGRLAPTPSGHLHLGNALAFGAAWLHARDTGAELLLRMEDIDRERSRSDVEGSIREDLRWLGIDWDREVPRQSSRSYSTRGLSCYRCTCSRARRRQGLCNCAHEHHDEGAVRLALDRRRTFFEDLARGTRRLEPPSDPVLVRSDGQVGYNLAVVADDVADGVTQIVRGADLLDSTPAQIQLWRSLSERLPSWLHVPLLLGPDGKKLSKSHRSTELRAMRHEGHTPEQIWRLLLPLLGLPPSLLRGAPTLDPARVPEGPLQVDEHGRLTGRAGP